MALPKKASDSKSSKKQKDRKKAHRKKKNSTLYVIEEQESIVEQTERINLVEQESDRVLIHADDEKQLSGVQNNETKSNLTSGEQQHEIGVLYVRQSSKEATNFDGDCDLDLSIDFADLVLSEVIQPPNFQTQFDTAIKEHILPGKNESERSSLSSEVNRNSGA